MASLINKTIKLHINSPYTDVIAFEKGRFKNINRELYEDIQKHFKSLDLNGDHVLDVHEVAKMMEKLGTPKTVSECRKIMAEMDLNNDGRVDFVEFLQLMVGPVPNLRKDGEVTSSMEIRGRIAKSGLSNHAAFFEQRASSTQDLTMDNKEAIKKDYEERKKIAELRKAEQEKERQAAEEEERQKKEAKSRMAARLAAFQ